MGGDAAVQHTKAEAEMALKERVLTEIKWDKPGTVVLGRLLRVNKVKYDDGPGLKYLVRDSNGKLVTFAGTTQINMLLTSDDLGKLLEVCFVGADSTREPRPGYSAAKVFRVSVDEESKDPATITDEDIPF
jgi:hypothetical protein